MSTFASKTADQTARLAFLTPEAYGDWDKYVLSHPDSVLYHLSGWADIIGKTYGHPAYYLTAFRVSDIGKRITGVLPLFHLKHFAFGNSLISVPFFDMGGIVADDAETSHLLLNEALALARKLRSSEVELRQLKPVPGADGIPGTVEPSWFCKTRTHKVRLLLELPGSAAKLMDSFKSKLRSQIRKAIKDGLDSTIGGVELLDEFYRVFAVNMRDLGSPVHSKVLIRNVMAEFGGRARIVLVRKDGRTLAGSLILGFRDVLENPWASALARFRKFNPNMLLYWAMLEYACEHGFRFFDFGRSTVGEGTYRFKEQWGATPVPLHWQYFQSDAASGRPDSPDPERYGFAVRCWQKLPVPLTRLVGPAIRKHIGL